MFSAYIQSMAFDQKLNAAPRANDQIIRLQNKVGPDHTPHEYETVFRL